MRRKADECCERDMVNEVCMALNIVLVTSVILFAPVCRFELIMATFVLSKLDQLANSSPMRLLVVVWIKLVATLFTEHVV